MSSLPGVTIRSARPTELPLLAPLELRAAERFSDSAHAYARALPPFDAGELAELERAGTVWVAVEGDSAPVGFAIAGWLGNEPYLHELDVEPSHARRGVGRALIRRVAEWARSTGSCVLALSTFRDVPWNGPYYQRLGFEVVPLEEYTAEQHAQRVRDGAAGMLIESRVIMRAQLERLLAQ